MKKAILDKAAKEGMNRRELDRHIVVATVPKMEAKAPFKAPASWKVPTVGGKFEGKAEPFKAPASWKVPSVGGRFEGKAAKADVGAVLDKTDLFKMRTRAMAANLTDWQREALSRPYIVVDYNEDRNRYQIWGRRAKENADDLTPAEAV